MRKITVGGGRVSSINKRKLVGFSILLLVLTVGIFFSYSRATLKKQESIADATLKVGTLSYTLKMNGIETVDISAEPLKWSYVDIEVTNNNPIDTKYEVVYTYVTGYKKATIEYFGDHDAPSGVIKAGETKKTRLRIHNPLSSSFTEELQLKVIGSLMNDNIEKSSKDYVITKAEEYKEDILNGTDPVLTSNLVPVNISDNGTVTKASAYDAWYEYSQRRWANAVVLINKTNYSDGVAIPESNIQSYFVWIPRYRYQIFNTGNYTSLGTLSSTAVQTINVVFENKSTAVSTGSSVNAWLTHPAFTTFNSNGFWVGKFESGYKGATSTTRAEQNNNNYANLIIKPNVYSWRNITVGNAFKVSYDYLRSDDSHMMKNTEWGAVAYLQHSSYGSRASVRVNNNSSFLTGYAAVSEPTCGLTTNNVSSSCNLMGTTSDVTLPYNTSTGYTASTTANISGVYDMSGGTWEQVIGFVLSSGDASGIDSVYNNFWTGSEWTKYYDKYKSSSSTTLFNMRILGDATGEMGPFFNVTNPNGTACHNSSWYNDYGYSPETNSIWFERGGGYRQGNIAGIFSFSGWTGAAQSVYGFRVVLTPQ